MEDVKRRIEASALQQALGSPEIHIGGGGFIALGTLGVERC
jgi:hypothetical protein